VQNRETGTSMSDMNREATRRGQSPQRLMNRRARDHRIGAMT